jgi:hypothetical protein
MGKQPTSEKSAWASKSAKPTTDARRSVHLFPPLPNLGREPEQASTLTLTRRLGINGHNSC